MVWNIVALYKEALVYYTCAKTAERTYLLTLTRYAGDPRVAPSSVVDLHYNIEEGWRSSEQDQELLIDLCDAIFSGGR